MVVNKVDPLGAWDMRGRSFLLVVASMLGGVLAGRGAFIMPGSKLQQRLDIPTLLVRAVGGLVPVILLFMLIVGCSGQSAQGGIPSEEAAVEEAVRGLFKALDAGNFEKAYSYYSPNHQFRRAYSQEEYVQVLKLEGVTGAPIHSVKVGDIKGNTATATVDYEWKSERGTYRYLWTVKVLKLDGQWKIGKTVSTTTLEAPNEASSQSSSAGP